METIVELKANPIFAMSLSSKELFHSNFWAWLFEHNIAYAKIFFPDIRAIAKVEREKGHRDLTIWQKVEEKSKGNYIYDDALIIENKFKSIPSKTQLQRYQENIENPKDKDGNIKISAIRRFCCGVLTGVEKPSFIDELDSWTFLSYSEIGNSIISTAEIFEESDSFEKTLIIKYGEMICDLQGLILGALSKTGYYWQPYNEKLHSLRINDIYSKILAGYFVEYLKKRLSDTLDTQVNDYSLVIESYYGHNGAGIDIRYIDKNNGHELTVIGIQIEGSQYRLCSQWNRTTKMNQSIRDNLFKSQKSTGWFVDYTPTKGKKELKDHITGEMRKTSMSKEYGVYDSGYTFLYQYWNLDKPASFDELTTMVICDMKLASDILKKSLC